MHDVRIDEAGIAAAFDARVLGMAPAAAPGAMVQAVPAYEAWQPVTRLVASVLANKVCPAWEVAPEIQHQWADALGECMEQLMPGGLANIEAWGPWGKLAFASGLWVMAGFDPDTMTIKPRYPVDPDDPDQQQKAPAIRGGSYTTDA